MSVISIWKVVAVMNQVSRKRASMPIGINTIINGRSVVDSHRRLAELLGSGMSVLDVGCGSGAITNGIALIVGEKGKAVGVDVNSHLINEAKQHAKDLKLCENLFFQVADIYSLPYNNEFDIVTSARVMQWLAYPKKALKQIIKAAKPGGTIIVLDYNHEKIKWQPEPPLAFRHFYNQFLNWRSNAGMENTIADQLKDMFMEAGLTDIRVSVQSETTSREDADFNEKIGIWAEVVATRGRQMVEDGYVTESERQEAEKQYREWVTTAAKSQTMYLLAVEGLKY